MATIIAKIESKINEYLKARNKEDWKEKTFTQAEKFSGIPRERIVSMAFLMLSIYVLLGNFLPLFSHIICIFWPVKESFMILRQQKNPSDNILLYWILYAMVSLFDYSALPGVPFYYFAKTGLFLSITTNGFDKLKEWSEPALKFTETWVLVTPPPPGEEEN
ncbi:HVA22/TB2/DP1 family protein [Caenorhabditis elegans]|uniref:Uncharacterized protein C06E1.1 n=1 Tax=Caenorhabditis elegans TaxID=6239 RepID=YKQ1_CAEEL|nr:Uncharacterized protein CELE_C06E1.1 [Caenorhabditis elegans]P34296.1 RecName: Full=Uncharacterized protein C06E1.1 [Caenorhabditis elegans]CCD62562.1 Uncharacterized protein CELE_C06E1.1 [Caenorhabditis elegans]|eukprot:NP_498893.1 Uncharacterized protein CELE_C06E1.1 [Caenorhabditis elegans]